MAIYMLFDNPADKQNMTFLNGNETTKIRQVYPSKKCNSTKEMLAVCKDMIKQSAEGDTIICWYDFMAVLCWWLCKVQFKNRKIIALNILLKDKATAKNKLAKFLYKPMLKSKKVKATVTSKKYGEHLNEMLGIQKQYTLLHDTYHGGYSIEYEGEVEPNSVFCGGRNGRKRYKSVHSPEAARYARHCGLQCHHDPRNGRRYSRRLRKNRAPAKGLGYKKQNEDHRTDARRPVREHTSEPLRRPVIQRRTGVLFKKQSGEREAGEGDSTGYPLAYPASESARRQAHWH